ncbi:30S ribosomal protein S18 [Nocardiopsis oceani]
MPPKSRRSGGRGAPRRFANPLGDADSVDYKDTNLLRKFISEKGKIRSRRVTRVTARQQRLVAAAVKNAREMALLPYPSSAKQG